MNPYIPKTLPLDDIDWASHVPLIGKANASIARYDGMLQSIVNPGLLLSPLTTQEAVLSSRIEGTQASMAEVMEYEADPREYIEPAKQADIHEIINYRKAMSQAVQSIEKRPFCLNLVKELHVTLLDSVRGRNKTPGEFRRIQNFIGPPGCTIENATFVPPSADQVNHAMGNWEKYLHYEEKDILVQLAIAKAQFELIHPFLDGNGRIGRMLIPLFLFNKGILSNPVFYLSAYFEAHRDLYYARLQALSREDDWNSWIRFFLNAVIEQAHVNADKTMKILGLYEKLKRDIPNVIRSQYVIQAIDALIERPIFMSSDFIARSKIPRDSGLRILKTLKTSGIIRELRSGKGRRPAVMIFSELISITERSR